jgi:hypothetical protein
MFGRALMAKKLALMRLQDTFQYLATLSGARVSDAHSRYVEASF